MKISFVIAVLGSALYSEAQPVLPDGNKPPNRGSNDCYGILCPVGTQFCSLRSEIVPSYSPTALATVVQCRDFHGNVLSAVVKSFTSAPPPSYGSGSVGHSSDGNVYIGSVSSSGSANGGSSSFSSSSSVGGSSSSIRSSRGDGSRIMSTSSGDGSSTILSSNDDGSRIIINSNRDGSRVISSTSSDGSRRIISNSNGGSRDYQQ